MWFPLFYKNIFSFKERKRTGGGGLKRRVGFWELFLIFLGQLKERGRLLEPEKLWAWLCQIACCFASWGKGEKWRELNWCDGAGILNLWHFASCLCALGLNPATIQCGSSWKLACQLPWTICTLTFTIKAFPGLSLQSVKARWWQSSFTRASCACVCLHCCHKASDFSLYLIKFLLSWTRSLLLYELVSGSSPLAFLKVTLCSLLF